MSPIVHIHAGRARLRRFHQPVHPGPERRLHPSVDACCVSDRPAVSLLGRRPAGCGRVFQLPAPDLVNHRGCGIREVVPGRFPEHRRIPRTSRKEPEQTYPLSVAPKCRIMRVLKAQTPPPASGVRGGNHRRSSGLLTGPGAEAPRARRVSAGEWWRRGEGPAGGGCGLGVFAFWGRARGCRAWPGGRCVWRLEVFSRSRGRW